jgi:crotonobetainyl-CoA:carnitine CoA-transferase CaiB-like acyl-CoA transferase
MTEVVLRVAEVSSSIAASACGRIFAALGHSVVKCEPSGGDALRGLPPLAADRSSWVFSCLNGDKQSVVMDADNEPSRLTALLDDSDVLIADWADSTLLATSVVSELRHTHPDLVIVSLTTFGLGGDAPASDGDSLLAEAYGGLATLIGSPGRRPLALGGDQSAYLAAFAGFLGASTALIVRDRSGYGDLVDVAQCDVAAFADWKSDITYAVDGRIPRRHGVDGGPWRIVPARDGWVGIVFQPHQWHAIKQLVGDSRLNDPRFDSAPGRAQLAAQLWPVVESWAAGLDKRVIYERAQAAGLPFGYAADVADLATWPQFRSRGFISERPGSPVGALVQSSALPWRTGAAPKLDADGARFTSTTATVATRPGRQPAEASSSAPLAGTIVLDLGTITAGAATARLLADYGATVIKVESTDRPDPFRSWYPATEGEPGGQVANPMFDSNNAGKQSVALDLKSPADLASFHDLVRSADVLIENFRVGVTARLGIDFASIHTVNERLLYLSLSSYGQYGPDAGATSFGSSLDLMSGLASITGYGDVPLWSSNQVNYPDQLVSLLGAGVVVYCLQQDVRGSHLDIAQVEAVTWTLAPYIADYLACGRVAGATGNARPDRAPCDTYPVADPDEWVAISCASERQRRILTDLVGYHADRLQGDSLDEAITSWTSRHPLTACVQQLRAAGIPSVPVLTAETRTGQDRFTERRVALTTPTRLKGHPFVLGSFTPAAPTPTPPLGADTQAVLRAAHSAADGLTAAAADSSAPAEHHEGRSTAGSRLAGAAATSENRRN